MKLIIKITILLGASFYLLSSSVVHAKELTIWDKLTQNFSLDHKENSPSVRAEIRRLTANKQQLERILTASSPYMYYIYQETQDHQLPGEIALIPFVESEFSPTDFSSKNAMGLWQLMPNTARLLGVKDVYHGGRRNIVTSTQAALKHFNYLGNYYHHNWYLALAAYNAGQGRVDSAIRYTSSRNFWDLPLPSETKHYVPKLLAISAIVKNPQKYGVILPAIPNKPYFAELTIKKPMNIKQIAKSLKTKVDILYALNPQYKYAHASWQKLTKLYVPVNVM